MNAAMPNRITATKALADLLSVLSHPARIRIVEELRDGERDVATLSDTVGAAPATTSQHLALLRTHHLVTERREGRHVYYRLVQPRIARWLVDGLSFVENDLAAQKELHDAVTDVRALWAKKKR
ncbi:MAG: helix-turn-helix transcriptional regulator [Myxococcales bacterium]|nr:helix-turn-helix transcriptional regulator [Myxococcales bacterium]